MSSQAAALEFANLFKEPVRFGISIALNLLPPHLVPQITADSQSPWIMVTTIPGPSYAIWRATGNVYAIGQDGAVDEDPIGFDLSEVSKSEETQPVPESRPMPCPECNSTKGYSRVGDHRVQCLNCNSLIKNEEVGLELNKGESE